MLCVHILASLYFTFIMNFQGLVIVKRVRCAYIVYIASFMLNYKAIYDKQKYYTKIPVCLKYQQYVMY